MPTSGVTAWSLTADQVCKAAAVELGVINSGETLTLDEIADCIFRLNALLKSWQGRGYMFREGTGEVIIPAAAGSGLLPASIQDITEARVVLSSTNERTLMQWNRGQYLSLPNKTSAGSPTAFYVSKLNGGNVLYVWPVPAEETTLKIDYTRAAETVTASTQTIDFPEEWQECLIKNLAVRIANMFGTTRSDPGTVQKIAAEAADLERQMLDSDRPDSYYMGTARTSRYYD